MNPTLEQLARYITQELERGIPESTLRAALMQHGWTEDWVTAALRVAKQSPVSAQAPAQQLLAPIQTDFAPQVKQSQPVMPPAQLPPARPQPTVGAISEEPTPSRSKAYALLSIIAIVLITIGVGAYLIVNGINKAETARQARDADRRADLAILLSDLSDYYVEHSAYPTYTQLGNQAFLSENGFDSKSIEDPQWSAVEGACVKDEKPIPAKLPTAHCYSYNATTPEESECNNEDIKCTRMTLTIMLEKEKEPYAVTFEKNSEVE